MDWTRWESDWYANSSGHLQEHVSLAAEVHNFVEYVATHQQIVSPGLSEARFLERLLLRRLGEEYRAVDMLTESGHGFQAMSACANLFELAHTLGYIVSKESASAEWLASNKKDFVPWKVKTLVVNNGQKLGWDKIRADEEYDRYGFLCGFKHNNPVFVRFLQLPVDPDLFLAQSVRKITTGSVGCLSIRKMISMISRRRYIDIPYYI